VRGERCEVVRPKTERECGKPAEFFALVEQINVCPHCRDLFYTLDEVEPIEQRPRFHPLIEDPMTITLAVHMPDYNFRDLLSDLVDTVVDEVDQLAGRLLDQVERAQRALKSGVN
jgi:hypothetical protein